MPRNARPWDCYTLIFSLVFSLIFSHSGNIICACLAGRTTTIRRSAVRKAGVSQHQWGPIEAPLEIPRDITALSYWGALNWPPIMPTDASLTNSRSGFLQSGGRADLILFITVTFCRHKLPAAPSWNINNNRKYTEEKSQHKENSDIKIEFWHKRIQHKNSAT